MKKRVGAAFLAVVLFWGLVGCNSSSVSSSSLESSESSQTEELEDALFQEINGKIPQAFNVSVHENDDGTYDVSYSIDHVHDITNFATYVKELLDACDIVSSCRDNISFGSVFFVLYDDEIEPIVSFLSQTDDEYFGAFIDYRSGESEVSLLKTYEDLQDLFPASKLDDEDKIIYPVGAGSKYFDEAEETIPDSVFSETAEENGLAGTVYIANINVVEKVTDDEMDAILVDIGSHSAIIVRMDAPNEEDVTDYSLPDIGDKRKVYLTYMGFSDIQNAPLFIYGANEYLVESLREETADESTLSTAANNR